MKGDVSFFTATCEGEESGFSYATAWTRHLALATCYLAEAAGRSGKGPGKGIEWWRELVGMNGLQEPGHIRTSHC